MYIAIDIGGTKTLVSLLDDDGVLQKEQRFLTDQDYRQFLADVSANVLELQLDDHHEYLCCAGMPGLLDRERGIALAFGNLPWRNVPIRDDLSQALGGRPLLIENDARLAGLSEAQLIKQYKKVLFLTVSTGIGGALIIDGKLDQTLRDIEVGKMPLWYHDTYSNWEEFSSGRAIVNRFNQKAFEITDPAIWSEIGTSIAIGVAPLCAVLTPEAIVIGGSVGVQAEKYKETIHEFLHKYLHPVVKQPAAILAAQRPDDAVIYGCYDLAKQSREA